MAAGNVRGGEICRRVGLVWRHFTHRWRSESVIRWQHATTGYRAGRTFFFKNTPTPSFVHHSHSCARALSYLLTLCVSVEDSVAVWQWTWPDSLVHVLVYPTRHYDCYYCHLLTCEASSVASVGFSRAMAATLLGVSSLKVLRSQTSLYVVTSAGCCDTSSHAQSSW